MASESVESTPRTKCRRQITSLLRSCTEVDTNTIDLSTDQSQQPEPELNVQDVSENRTDEPNQLPDPVPKDPTPVDLTLHISFVVGDDGVLTLQPKEPEIVNEAPSSTTTCPPELALPAIECSYTLQEKEV